MNSGGSFDAMVQLDALSHALSLNSSIKSSLTDVINKLNNTLENNGSSWKDSQYEALKNSVTSIACSLVDLTGKLDKCSDKIADLADIVKKYQEQKITSVDDIE